MRRVILIILSIILLSSCAKEVSEVIEKYENGNWKKVIVYKVKGESQERYKLIEYYENGKVKQEIDLRESPGLQLTQAQEEKSAKSEKEVLLPPVPVEDKSGKQENVVEDYQGPYADLMNQPGAVTRKLEGEEKERVLAAMRKQKEEQQKGEEFTEQNEDGENVTKVRKVLDKFEDGSKKHEQIFIKSDAGLELEKDIVYYSNGQIRTYVPYEAGIANGKWLNYYRNGTLKTEGHSQNGDHNGEYIQYYENGKPMMKGKFVNGKMEGKWQHYWENGNLQMETTFENDREVGPTKRFDESGKEIKHQSPFRVGEKMNFGNR